MNITRLRVVATFTLLAALAAGCTTTSAGEPRPGETATQTSEPPSSEDRPERPQEIKLDATDPCTLVPESDYSDYYLEKPGKPETEENGAAACVWFGDIGYFGITLETTEGIGVWLDGRRKGRTKEADPIEGFPTITIENPDNQDGDLCFVSVDVAEGQQLIIQVGLDSIPTDIPPICEYAHQFAESAMSTLVES